MTLCPHCRRPMLRDGLTPRQKDCLNAIWAYWDQHGVSPTHEELAAALGMASKSNITRLLNGLEERGWVNLTRYRSRSLVPLERPA